jgi:hypothetical protein
MGIAMTNTASKIITAAIVAFALASAVMASPASAAPVFPADLVKSTSTAAKSNASDQCLYSRFGCSIGHR